MQQNEDIQECPSDENEDVRSMLAELSITDRDNISDELVQITIKMSDMCNLVGKSFTSQGLSDSELRHFEMLITEMDRVVNNNCAATDDDSDITDDLPDDETFHTEEEYVPSSSGEDVDEISISDESE